MITEHKENHPTEHRVGNTLYRVTPVFTEAPTQEGIEDKIMRLILLSGECKSVKT